MPCHPRVILRRCPLMPRPVVDMRGSRVRSAVHILMIVVTTSRARWPEGARRYQAWLHIGVVQGIELRPQHVAFEADGIDDRGLHRQRRGASLDELEGEVGIAVRLVEAAVEVLHGTLTD